MQAAAGLVLLWVAMVFAAGCGKGLQAVSVASASGSVLVSGTLQFSATVTGSMNQAVTWSVNGIAGGNATVGTISAAGSYVAPGSILPSNNAITITAASQALQGVSGSMTISVLYPLPVTSALNLPVVPIGSPATAIVVSGSGFTASTTVLANGSLLASTFVGANQMSATIPASLLASRGTDLITTSNPAPGGGTSADQAALLVSNVYGTRAPNLSAAMSNYDFVNRPPIWIACFGSSVSVGATLADPSVNAPCSYFVTRLKATVDPGNRYNFQAANFSVNGSVMVQFGVAWTMATTYALSGLTIGAPGTGYAVGDWVTVNEGATTRGGAAIVTAVGANGSVTGIKLSPYLGTVTANDRVDQGGPTTSLYTIANGVATLDGPPPDAGIAEQTGSGKGLTVNVTAVGIKPVVSLLAYGMNDGATASFNSGETLNYGLRFMGLALNQIQSAGADAFVLTSPHPSVVQYAALLFAPVSFPCLYPAYTTTCTSSQVAPDATLSISTVDSGVSGIMVSLGSRYLDVNTGYRQYASTNNATLIDVERYWTDALGQETLTTGSNLGAEKMLFNPGEVVHPNDLGHQMSYHRGIDDLMISLGAILPRAAAQETSR